MSHLGSLVNWMLSRDLAVRDEIQWTGRAIPWVDVRVSVVHLPPHLASGALSPGKPRTCTCHSPRRASRRAPVSLQSPFALIMSKRARQDSAGPFLSRINAADIIHGETERPGGFIEGRIYSTNSRKNQYTIDIRPSSKARAVYLDVFIDDSLQRRLGELFVGDHLRILLQGALLLPYTGSPTHLPAILRYKEGITLLLVSRAGLRGEKEKLLSVWPKSCEYSILASVGYNPLVGADTGKAKKRKQSLNVDNPVVEWFSTPPLSNANRGVEEGTSGTRAAATAGGPYLTISSEQSPTPSTHSEVENDAGPSTSATAFVDLASSRKSPLTIGESRGSATYAYRTARSRERSSPVDPTSVQESSSTSHSYIPPIPVPSTSKQQLSGCDAVLPSRGPSEPPNRSATPDGPPSSKQKSNRKRKRELREAALSAASMPPATTNDPTSAQNTPTVPVEDRDICSPSRRYDSQTGLGADATSILANIQPERVTVAQRGSERARSDEGVERTGGIANAEPISDDPLNMRAGLIVNGVSFFP